MKQSLFLFALAVASAAAQTPAVNAAIAAGQVGERYDGYVGVAAPVSATVRSQIATINIRRRALYSNLAASRCKPSDVGITAGCQLLARLPWARLISGTTVSGGAARQERPRPCLTIAAELRTNSGRPASSPKSAGA